MTTNNNTHELQQANFMDELDAIEAFDNFCAMVDATVGAEYREIEARRAARNARWEAEFAAREAVTADLLIAALNSQTRAMMAGNETRKAARKAALQGKARAIALLALPIVISIAIFLSWNAS